MIAIPLIRLPFIGSLPANRLCAAQIETSPSLSSFEFPVSQATPSLEGVRHPLFPSVRGLLFAETAEHAAAAYCHTLWRAARAIIKKTDRNAFDGTPYRDPFWRAVDPINPKTLARIPSAFTRIHNGRLEYDIANLPFENLAPSLQKENLDTARAVRDLIQPSIATAIVTYNAFLNLLAANEKAGETIFERYVRYFQEEASLGLIPLSLIGSHLSTELLMGAKKGPESSSALGTSKILMGEGNPTEKTRLYRARSGPFGEISGMTHKGAARKIMNADGLSFVKPKARKAIYLIGADGAGSSVHAKEAANMTLKMLSEGILANIGIPKLFPMVHQEVLGTKGASVAMVTQLEPISGDDSTISLKVYWGGDYKGVLFRRHGRRYRPIYHTRDDSEVRNNLEGLPASHPAWKNPELWLMSQPRANKVFNAIGGSRPPRANSFENGEFIAPQDSSIRWSAQGTETIYVRKGDVWLMASDGLWECFGHYDQVSRILDRWKGTKNMMEAFKLEILRRMTLVERAEDPRSGGSISLENGRRIRRLTSDGHVLDSSGNIIDHFKIDNFSFFLYQH